MTKRSPRQSEAADPASEELGVIGSGSTPILIKLVEFNGSRFLDIRRYYRDRKSKELKPTPKGIALKEDELLLLASLISEHGKTLNQFFIDKLDATDISRRLQQRERAARQRLANQVDNFKVAAKRSPGTSLFSVTSEGATRTLTLNTNNALIAAIVESKGSNIAASLFVAYVAAREFLDTPNKVNATDLLNLLEANWSERSNRIGRKEFVK